MKKRYIVVPKDNAAVLALDFDLATEEQILEMVLNEEDFISLYNDKVFYLINEWSGASIDDYEDYKLDDIEKLKRSVNQLILNKKSFQNKNQENVSQIIILFQEAIVRNTGVSFYF